MPPRLGPGTVGRVTRLLLTRRWLTWLLVALLASVACFFLGRWQWHRWESRGAAQEVLDTNYDAAPVDLRSVLPPPGSPLPKDRYWRRVVTTGRYEPQAGLLVRNRPRSKTYGFEVLVPLRLDDGGLVVVDRGWVPNGSSADRPGPVPPPPAGPVRVTGWLRPGEPDLGRTPVPGQVASIHLPLVARTTGLPVHPRVYLRMEDERTAAGATPPRPVPLDPPEPGMAAGVNLSYAVQWWLAMIAFPVLVVLSARREADGPRPERPRRTRIWDEEDA